LSVVLGAGVGMHFELHFDNKNKHVKQYVIFQWHIRAIEFGNMAYCLLSISGIYIYISPYTYIYIYPILSIFSNCSLQLSFPCGYGYTQRHGRTSLDEKNKKTNIGVMHGYN